MALHTKDFGRMFWVTLDPERFRGNFPLLHVAPTWEIDPPFRESPISFVIRPNRILRKGLVVGWWRKTGIVTLEEAEIRMGLINPEDVMDRDDVSAEEKALVRKNIAAHGMSLEDEMKVMQALDLM